MRATRVLASIVFFGPLRSTSQAAGPCVDLRAREPRFEQDGAGAGRERVARFRGHHAARPALEQLRLEHALEPVQALRQRRLRNAEVRRSTAHGAVLDYREKVLQLPNLHSRPISVAYE